MVAWGYFEGLDSQRAIVWRCQDSLTLREFLGVGVGDRTRDHCTLTLTRQRPAAEVLDRVFWLTLSLARERWVLGGRYLGADSTTLDAVWIPVPTAVFGAAPSGSLETTATGTSVSESGCGPTGSRT